jgi:hypothetical protein
LIYCFEQPDASDKHILPSTQQIFMKDVRYHQGMKIKSMLSQLCGKGILEHKSHKSGSAMDPSVAELPETFTGVGTSDKRFKMSSITLLFTARDLLTPDLVSE